MAAEIKNFVVVNAFGEAPFGGNPAAVFADGSNLESGTMQALARQLNLVETVFVLPPEQGADFRLRFFTPDQQIPVAGHPSIATWLALLYKGLIDGTERTAYRQENVAAALSSDSPSPFHI